MDLYYRCGESARIARVDASEGTGGDLLPRVLITLSIPFLHPWCDFPNGTFPPGAQALAAAWYDTGNGGAEVSANWEFDEGNGCFRVTFSVEPDNSRQADLVLCLQPGMAVDEAMYAGDAGDGGE